MPYSCCVPYCHGNYTSKNRISVFKFPNEEHMKRKWINAIPRSNYTISFNSRVCENHFRPEDVRRETSYLDEKTGKTVTAKLYRPYLISSAVPSIFPSCPEKPLRKSLRAKKLKVKDVQPVEERLKEAQVDEDVDMLNSFPSGKVVYTYSTKNNKVSTSNTVDANSVKKQKPSKHCPETDPDTPPDVNSTAENAESEVKTPLKKSLRLRKDTLKKAKLEKMRKSSQLIGRRIVDIGYFIQQIQEISDHGYASCSFKDMVCVSEHRRGFRSSIKFRCKLCFLTKSIWTNANEDSEEHTAVNAAAIAGIKRIGGGHTKLKILTDALSIPCLNRDSYTKELEIMEKVKHQALMGKPLLENKEIVSEKSNLATEDSRMKVENDEIQTAINRSNLQSLSALDSEKPPDIILEFKPGLVNDLEPNALLRPVTESDFIVELDSETLITPDINPPDLSEPKSSDRTEYYPIKMEQVEVDQAMTCDIYLTDVPQLDSMPKIKKEPIDPDEYRQVILSTTVAQGLNNFSSESSSISNQNGSLFQLPVLIKEEPVCFEEES